MAGSPASSPQTIGERIATALQDSHAPAWLAPAREAARGRASTLGLPERRTERWRYSVPRFLQKTTLGWPGELPAQTVPEDAAASFHNGMARLGQPLAGVEIATFENLSASASSLVVDLLDRRQHQHFWFADLNTALLRDGLFIHVHHQPGEPAPHIVIDHCLGGSPATAAHSRLLVIVDPKASATLTERHPGTAAGPWHNAVAEVVLGSGAQLQHERLHLDGPESHYIGACDVRLAADSSYHGTIAASGGAFHRTDLTINSRGPGAHSDIQALLAAANRDRMDLHLDQEHSHPGTSSDSHVNALAAGSARVVVNGRIHIHPGATNTAAHLHNRNILLSSAAEIDTKPELEIYNDDVQCSHGASVGALDSTALFYLQSRGVPRRRALRLLINALVHESIGHLGPHGAAFGQHVAKQLEEALA